MPATSTTTKAPAFKQIARWILGGIIVLLFAIATVIVLLKGDVQFITLILGALIGSFSTIVGFYFGSVEEQK